MPPRCYRFRQTAAVGCAAPLMPQKKGRFSGMSQKSTFSALAQQVDDVEAGVALGDDVAAAKDAGG